MFFVILGHYATWIQHPAQAFLWLPATAGLSVFAFSSGYFTSIKYALAFSIPDFWRAKVPRLLGPLLVADVFIFSLLLTQGAPNLLHWHTVLAFFGMSGTLLWSDFFKTSPMGRGVWFFTLLIAFYLIYPLLARIIRNRTLGFITILVTFVTTAFLGQHYPVGVAFWQTTWFFILGAYCGHPHGHFNPTNGMALMLVCGAGVPLCKLSFTFEWMLYPLIMGMCAGINLVFTTVRLPRIGGVFIAFTSGIMLEVYLIHTYLFVALEGKSQYLCFVISLLLILLMGFVLKPAGRLTGSALLVLWDRIQTRHLKP